MIYSGGGFKTLPIREEDLKWNCRNVKVFQIEDPYTYLNNLIQPLKKNYFLSGNIYTVCNLNKILMNKDIFYPYILPLKIRTQK